MSEPHDEQPGTEPGGQEGPGDVADPAGQPEPRDPGAGEPRDPGAGEPRDPGAGEPRDAGAGEPRDPNVVAIEAAAVDERMTAWLHQVAGQVDPRLDRVAAGWRDADQAQAARACAFGLLLAHLARTYPHARDTIHRVVEAHPSYSTLTPGERLATLERIAGDPASMAAWVGPLIGVTDSERVRLLLE